MKNLIVVDMQKGFMCDKNSHLINSIKQYIKANNFEHIIFTKCVNNIYSPFVKILNWNGVMNETEQEIVLDIPKDAIIITKNSYGLDTAGIERIKQLGITEAEICGTDIDACCLAIAFNLFDNNIRPIILKDLCASSSSNDSIVNYATAIIKRQFGEQNLV